MRVLILILAQILMGTMGGVAPAGSLSFDFTTGSLPGGTTLTRASSGTYIDSGGILQTATSNVARFQYASGTPYLLYEPAATNLLKQSNAFTTTWFAQNSAVATAAQFTSPDGTNDGWSLTSGTGFGAVAQAFTFSAVPYTLSIWAEKITGTCTFYGRVGVTNFFGPISVTTTIGRYSGTLTPSAGSQNVNFLCNNSSGITGGIFGAQMETGAVATSYIVTTAATVTRSADQLAFTIPAGVGHLTVTFSDNTTQSIAVSPGAYTLTNTLNEYMIKTIVSAP